MVHRETKKFRQKEKAGNRKNRKSHKYKQLKRVFDIKVIEQKKKI